MTTYFSQIKNYSKEKKKKIFFGQKNENFFKWFWFFLIASVYLEKKEVYKKVKKYSTTNFYSIRVGLFSFFFLANRNIFFYYVN